jgi:hypothetical protein
MTAPFGGPFCVWGEIGICSGKDLDLGFRGVSTGASTSTRKTEILAETKVDHIHPDQPKPQ